MDSAFSPFSSGELAHKIKVKKVNLFAVILNVVFLLPLPANTKEYKLNCMCVVSLPFCSLKVFDEIAEMPRQEWSQSIFSEDGEPSEEELALACWRKRDMGGLGACCSKTNDQQDARIYFKGRISP